MPAQMYSFSAASDLLKKLASIEFDRKFLVGFEGEVDDFRIVIRASEKTPLIFASVFIGEKRIVL